MDRRSIVWFRSDLRLHDNQALVEAVQSSDCIYPIYVFDPRIFKGDTSLGFRKTGRHRARFIIESVKDLRKSLESRGLKLIVRTGHPELIIYEVARELKSTWVFCNRERTHEEVLVQDQLERNLWSIGQEMRYVRGKMLLYTQDLPFPVTHAPDQFATLRKDTEHFVRIRKPLDIPEMYQETVPLEDGKIPEVEDFGHSKVAKAKTSQFFGGGESTVMYHLQTLVKKGVASPCFEEKRTRFSPWISHGCLSPKLFYHQILAADNEEFFDCSHTLANSLLRRDYYRLIGKKYKHQIFLPEGPLKVKKALTNADLKKAAPWLDANTGVPIVDACLTELISTGYLSHRRRVLVANYLVAEMGVSWLVGAEFFESLLLDYDPCSNYGNWNHVAGVGVDLTKDRVTSFSNQEKVLDPDGTYVDYWLSDDKVISL